MLQNVIRNEYTAYDSMNGKHVHGSYSVLKNSNRRAEQIFETISNRYELTVYPVVDRRFYIFQGGQWDETPIGKGQ